MKGALRRTARYGNGWHATYRSNEELQELRDQLARICEEEGRDISELELSLRGPLSLAPEPRGRFRGPPEHVAASLQDLQDIGFTHYVFETGQSDPGAAQASVEQIGAELLPHL